MTAEAIDMELVHTVQDLSAAADRVSSAAVRLSNRRYRKDEGLRRSALRAGQLAAILRHMSDEIRTREATS